MKNNKNISRKDRLKSKRLAPANYLIVCEGKQTEPNYFNGLKKKINKKTEHNVPFKFPANHRKPNKEEELKVRTSAEVQALGLLVSVS